MAKRFFHLVTMFFGIVFLAQFLSGCELLDSKIKAGLQINTTNGTSSIFLDDQYLDKTPYVNKKLKPGVYKMRIEPDDANLVKYEQEITLRKGTITVVSWNPGTTPKTSGGVIYELEPSSLSRNKSEISFTTTPDNAIIQFDNREKTMSPIAYRDVEPGSHEFSASQISFQPQQHNIDLPKGYKLLVSVQLARTEGDGLIEDDQKSGSVEDAFLGDSSNTKVATNASSLVKSSEINTGSRNSLIKDATSSAGTSSSSGKVTSALTGDRVKIKATNYFVSGVEVLRVRDSASSSGSEIGTVEVGSEFRYLGETTNGWHKIEFSDKNGKKTGWISEQFSTLITN